MANATLFLHSDQFDSALADVLSIFSKVDSLTVVGFPAGTDPFKLADVTNHEVVPRKADMDHYILGAYLLDPFYQAAVAKSPTGMYRLVEIAPDEFEEGEYFRQFYQYSNLVDEIGYLLEFDGIGHLHLSAAAVWPYAKSDLRNFEMMTPWILAMLEQQWKPAMLQRKQCSEQSQQGSKLTELMEQFGGRLLTNRESEIAHLLLRGHSNKSIARKLDISPETIKVHRRNLYCKLSISTHAELFTLFINSLPLARNQN